MTDVDSLRAEAIRTQDAFVTCMRKFGHPEDPSPCMDELEEADRAFRAWESVAFPGGDTP